MGVIFTGTSAVGLAPVFLRRPLSRLLVSRAATRSRMLSCALCFGAGVFLFVCFMGLLPAADSKFHHFLEELSHTDERWEKFAEFPWGFFVVTCGFLIIFTVDKLVHAADDARRRRSNNQTQSTTTTTPTTTTTTSINPGHIQLTHPKHQHHDSSHNEEGGGGGGKGVPSSVMFLVALGTHSVFEGVAVGLQTKADKVLEFAVAVLVHELVMAFTFGLEVSSNEVLSRCKKVTYILLFTSTIPLGIAVGVGLQNAPSANREIVSAVLEAFATGIFIHIIFIEVLAKEFPAHHNHNHNHYNHHHDYSNNFNHLDPQQELIYHHHHNHNTTTTTTTTTPWNQQRATYHHQTYHQDDHQYHNHDYQYHTSNSIHDDNPPLHNHNHNHNPLYDDQLHNEPHNQHQLELQQQQQQQQQQRHQNDPHNHHQQYQLQNYPHNHQLQQQQQQQNDSHNQIQQYHLNQHQHNTYPLQENYNHHHNTTTTTHQDTSPNHNHHNHNHDNRTSETCLILEKIASICCGVSIMIVLNLFLHTHH
ncbi:hypothetical protein Pmani_037973 [Petrolisthes manimaculis]|uniref:Zinc transporter ZIP3 n=1 Tax=Petrolisthes manimaculis TaxID=1843537 RepID=A0AAE1NHB4_9EUCA|nr:hypothetical protein Pmani_037973 [Petrolisthes manimaculis]